MKTFFKTILGVIVLFILYYCIILFGTIFALYETASVLKELF